MKKLIFLFLLIPLFSAAQLKEFNVIEMERPDVAVVQANTKFPDDALLLVYSSLKDLNFRSSLGGIDKVSYNTKANRYEILFKPNKQMLFVYSNNFVEQKIETFNPNPKDVFYYKVEESQQEIVNADPGSLKIITKPVGADVYINGMRMADKTPFTGSLPEAKISLTIKYPDHEDLDTIVYIKAAESTELKLGLTKVKSSIKRDTLEFLGYTGDRIQDVDGNEYSVVKIGKQGYTGDMIQDVDGNEYSVVKIGKQTWMGQNLNTTKFADGSSIPAMSESDVRGEAGFQYSESLGSGGMNTILSASSKGKLYNWYAVDDRRGLCPTGWHIPTEEDWIELLSKLGGYEDGAGELKAEGDFWNYPNDGANDKYDFTALPMGIYKHSEGKQKGTGSFGYWWSSTEYGIGSAKSVILQYLPVHPSDSFYRADLKEDGLSVRCVKNK